jgi:transcriptional regulator with XRE-family HTH domain
MLLVTRPTPPAERRAFGLAVRELRARRGWSLGDLGERTLVHAAYLDAVERAEVEPGLRTMTRIAEGFELPLSLLIAHSEARLVTCARLKR